MQVKGSFYWDILGLYSKIKDGLKIYARSKRTLSGIGIDTWGVDFGLIDGQGRLVGNPRAYRDPRGRRGRDAFFKDFGGACGV